MSTKTRIAWQVVVAAGLVVCGRPATAQQQSWRLQVELIDGSRIVGEPLEKAIQIDVDYGKLEIPLQRIHRAVWNNEDRSTRIELANRDILTGRVLLDELKLKTIFGDINLAVKHIQSFDVVPIDLTGWLPTQQGLVVYFSFDRSDADRVKNLAGDQHHGKSFGTTWIERGKRGGAVAFDGSSHIEVPHHVDLCPQSFTLAAWLYPDDGQSGYQAIIAKTQPSSWNGGYGLVRLSSDTKYAHFFINYYSGTATKTELANEKWSHVAGVCDGKELTIYLNGKPQHKAKTVSTDPFDGSPTSSGQIKHSTGPLTLGSDNRSGYYWRGKMDEFVLYNRALSEKEIWQLYQSGGQ